MALTKDLQIIEGAAIGLNLASINHPANPFDKMGLPPTIGAELGAIAAQKRPKFHLVDRGGPQNDPIWATETLVQQTTIPIGQMMLQAQEVARGAESQLEGDIRAIQASNLITP